MAENPISSAVGSELLVAGRAVTMARTTVVLFIYCLLLMETRSKTQACTVTGQTGFMEFSKEGDLIIGGVFSMSSRRVLVDNDYMAIPSAYCTR